MSIVTNHSKIHYYICFAGSVPGLIMAQIIITSLALAYGPTVHIIQSPKLPIFSSITQYLGIGR